ncbi:MAG: lysophospholipid acyltransferase family protein, partial [Eubacteriales bacterium]|nr:lysophospholipid acyltransferase family protein [Clostridiales bacterium]MDY5720035.1 lysophospholipid acyltransferase family protein [Eubacteriales bacterium]
MADKSRKNDKKTINMFLYRTLMPVLIGLSKIIVGVRTDKSALKGVKGPYLIVGNHTSPIDFLYFTAGVYPQPINFVVAENMIYRKVYGAFIRSFGTIKKKQFTADFQCIKQIKKNIDAGTHVLLFPEGRVSIDGTTGYIAPSIGKLIKFLN